MLDFHFLGTPSILSLWWGWPVLGGGSRCWKQKQARVFHSETDRENAALPAAKIWF